MEVQVKEVEYCKLEVLYSGDPDVVREKREEFVAELRKQQIPGFRKGKAPDSAIKARAGKKIEVYIAEQMKAQAYDDVIFETEAKPIGYPKFDNVSISGDKFSCKMTLYKKPDFELKDFKYEIPRPDINRDKEVEVQKALEDLRLRFGDIEPYGDDDFVERGDQITIGYTATIDGEPFEGSEAEGQLYVVGENSLPDFDDSVLGMSAGENREFEITFPEVYPDIGGKTAKFDVTVHMGTKKKPCALDDELAKNCGSDSLDALKDQLSKIASAKIKQAETLKVRQQVANRLVEDNDFKAPEFLVNLESQHISAQNGIDWNSLEENEQEVFKTQAEKQVKLSIILDSVRDSEPDSVLSDTEAQNGLAKKAQLQGRDPKTFLVEAQRNGSLIGMLSALKDEFTLQWLVDQATLID